MWREKGGREAYTQVGDWTGKGIPTPGEAKRGKDMQPWRKYSCRKFRRLKKFRVLVICDAKENVAQVHLRRKCKEKKKKKH